MLQLASKQALSEHACVSEDGGDYGVWTDYHIPEDRSARHPLVRRFYDYWVSVAPPGCLPGRQHIAPEKIPALWSRMSMLDCHRVPLRYRHRLCRTSIGPSLCHQLTRHWLDQ